MSGKDEPPAPKGAPIRTAKALREAARAHSRAAIDALAEIAAAPDGTASRLAAANAILDRAFGKVRAANEAEPETPRRPPVRAIERVLVWPKPEAPEAE